MLRSLLVLLCLACSAPALAAQTGPDEWDLEEGLPFVLYQGSQMVQTDADTFYFAAGGQYGSPDFYQFKLTSRATTKLTNIPVNSGYAASMAWVPGTNFIYLQPGNNLKQFFRFDMSANGGLGSWTKLEDPPWDPAYGTDLAVVDTGLFWLGGGASPSATGFAQFTPPELSDADGMWTIKTSTPASTFRGAVLTRAAASDFLYGGNDTGFWRYSITGSNPAGQPANTWVTLANIPEYLDLGSSLLATSATTLYLMTGNFGDDKFGYYRFNANPTGVGGGAWTRLTDRPGQCGPGATQSWISGDTIYATRSGGFYYNNGGTIDLWRYSIAGDRFAGPAIPTGMVADGASLISVDDGDTLYYQQGYNRNEFARYQVSTDTWTPLAPTPGNAPGGIWSGGSMAWDGGNFIFLTGIGNLVFARYAILDSPDGQSGDSWIRSDDTSALIPNLPVTPTTGAHLVRAGTDRLYFFPGSTNATYRFTISTMTWSSALPAPPAGLGSGSAAAWDRADAIYVFRGNNSYDFWVFSISQNQWNRKSDGSSWDPVNPTFQVTQGGALAYPDRGRDLFAFPGFSATGTNQFWSYTFPDVANPLGLWSQRANAPGTVHDGSRLAYPGAGKHLFALQGGLSRALWKYWLISDPPNAPTAPLSQVRLDGATSFQGITTAETGFVARATVTDPYGDRVRLQVEVKPALGLFDGNGLYTGAYVDSGSIASVTVPAGSLTPGDYHWRVRTQDDKEVVSATWTEFPTAGTDFTIRVNAGPAATALVQSQGGTVIQPGSGNFGDGPMRFTAHLDDANVPDQVRLLIEVRPLGVDFQGIPTTTGTISPNQTTINVDAGLAEGAYHWQACGMDEWNLSGTWVPYGTNSEDEADFQVYRFGSGNSGCLAGGGYPALMIVPAILAAFLSLRR